jgi:rhomboid protease GluP
MVASGTSTISPGADHLLRWGADFGPLTLHGQYWRVVTSSFVHVGIVHLTLNMLFLWWVSSLAERILGAYVIVCVYFVTGIGGELLSLTWQRLQVSAGASGAILGIAGVLISLFAYGKFKTSNNRLLRLRLITWVLFVLLTGLLPGVDNMAHLGGLLTGLLLGLSFVYLLRRSPPRRTLLMSAVFYRGRTAIENHEYEAAAADLSIYCAARPTAADCHVLLGYLLQTLERYDHAAEEYAHALTLHPEDTIAEVNLAGVFLRQGKKDDAVMLIQKRHSASPAMEKELF